MKEPDEKKTPKCGRCGCGKEKKQKPDNPGKAMRDTSPEMNSDVLGSYTGTPVGGGEPVQDADDL